VLHFSTFILPFFFFYGTLNQVSLVDVLRGSDCKQETLVEITTEHSLLEFLFVHVFWVVFFFLFGF